MEHLVIAPPPGSFGTLLRACRHRACLSQEQLAARAELSERTVRNLEAGRVRSPRPVHPVDRPLPGCQDLGRRGHCPRGGHVGGHHGRAEAVAG